LSGIGVINLFFFNGLVGIGESAVVNHETKKLVIDKISNIIKEDEIVSIIDSIC